MRWTISAFALLLFTVAAAQNVEYEIGGPLAGVKLPPWPARHGAPPGHPGSIPDTEFAARRAGMQYELYPGAVEHWSCLWMKYVPARSLFDRQSQLKNWTAPDLPGAGALQPETYAPPVYWIPDNAVPRDTGRKDPPVPVLRCRPGAPVFSLDLGELHPGVYVLRLIGAVETHKLRQFRLPLVVSLKVNDGPRGEVTTYRKRCNYTDEFYSVAELYFHALETRRYRAELRLDNDSQVDLLVHNISLDDALAGVVQRPLKTRQVLVDEETLNEVKAACEASPQTQKNVGLFKFTPAARLARDEMIWRYFPPDNAQGFRPYRLHGAGRDARAGITLGHAGMTAAEIAAKHGAWTPVLTTKRGLLGPAPCFPPDATNRPVFLSNAALKLDYTLDDWAARRPLPDPYPFKDDGVGLVQPDPQDPDKCLVFCPIADVVDLRLRETALMVDQCARLWLATRNPDIARDGAVHLIRFAWALPTLDSSYFLYHQIAARVFGCNDTVRQREIGDYYLHHYEHIDMTVQAYDYLFDFIQGNEDLARSVGRFVPWVKTPDDVIRLLDAYLVQTTVKRYLRYHHTRGQRLPSVIAALNVPGLSEPWSDFLFARIFQYPFNLVGIQDIVTSTFDRNGCNFIASAFYAQEGGARTTLAQMAPYLRTVAGSRYDLRDRVAYPKPAAHCLWRLNAQVAGADLLRIGDVRGPDKTPHAPSAAAKLGDAARQGWAWTRDPRFAWMLAHAFGRRGESDADWQALRAAAESVPRAPWLDNPSRFIANWAGILESGLQHDDYRFRRAVYVRTGIGQGHEHADTLDLQLFAHGLPMTVDDGQRSGYSKPNSRMALVHNLVEINKGASDGGFGHIGHAWTSELSDAPGARYMRCKAASPLAAGNVFERQTALIDVDEGRGSRPLSIKEQLPGARLHADVVTPNSYVFDVFRVSGGTTQTYLFHAMVNDDFQSNALDLKPVEHILPKGFKEEKPPKEAKEGEEGADAAEEKADREPKADKEPKFIPRTDAEYLSRFTASEGRKFGGRAPDIFEATWRYSRDAKTGSEQRMSGANYDEKSPRKFTRLTLFGVGGHTCLQADGECHQPGIGYRYTQVMIQQEAERRRPLQSVWPALIEPYAGEPLLIEKRPVPLGANDADALRAVALEVRTRNGHTDLCFADGRPEKTRTLDSPRFKGRVAAAFAYQSQDAQGLRAAAITGGTLLETPLLRLALPQPERAAKIVSVDYRARTFRIDRPWPSACAGRLFEVGVPGRRTAFTAVAVAPDAAGTLVTLAETAEMYRAPVLAVNPQERTVRAALQVMAARREFDADLIASNDTLTRFWRVNRVNASTWQAREGEMTPDDFQPANVLRLWEYGVGDTVRMACHAALRRIADGVYELAADGPVTLALAGRALESSPDGVAWQPLKAERRGETVEVRVDPAASPRGILHLRVK